MTDPPEEVPAATADSLLDKLRTFADGLEPGERRLLAALLAPGVDAAWDDSEVAGFDAGWTAERLPQHLVARVRARRLRIEGW